jgi:hypothetical protein
MGSDKIPLTLYVRPRQLGTPNALSSLLSHEASLGNQETLETLVSEI